MDQWELVLLLEKLNNQSLTFQDLFAQHNEHRIFFPRIIMLFGAYLTHWNIIFELFINIFLGVGIFAIIAKNVANLFKKESIPYKFWLISVISLLIFSLSQYENWQWGWQMQIFLNVLMVCSGLYFLTKANDSWFYFFLALMAGVVATFSFANGLLYWGIGVIVLLNPTPAPIGRGENSPPYWGGLGGVIWVMTSLLMAWSYLHDFQHPSEHPIPDLSFTYFVNYLAFIFAYLGNPIFESDANASLIFGIVGVAIYLLGWSKIYQNKGIINQNAYLIFFYFSLYSILSAFITGLGRTGLGLSIAAASRYITICNLFWINNFVLLFSLFREDLNLSNTQIKTTKALIIILGLVIFASHIVGTLAVVKHHHDLADVKTELLKNGSDSTILKKTYPKTAVILEHDLILKKYKLSYRIYH